MGNPLRARQLTSARFSLGVSGDISIAQSNKHIRLSAQDRRQPELQASSVGLPSNGIRVSSSTDITTACVAIIVHGETDDGELNERRML